MVIRLKGWTFVPDIIFVINKVYGIVTVEYNHGLRVSSIKTNLK
jgi:hypothetical protein